MKRLILAGLLCFLMGNAQAYTFVFHVHLQNNKEHVIDKDKLVERHNFYRKKLGIPPLEWSDELAEVAQKWANKLARSCQLAHSSDNDYGENIYWRSKAADEDYVVDRWASEEKYFDHKKKTYKRGQGSKYGHYTQIIWRETTHVGAGVKNCSHGGQIWVCNYDPAGNMINAKVY